MKPDQFSITKSFELSYALIRLADNLSGNYFAEYLRRLGLEVLYSATMGDAVNTLKVLRSTEYMIRLAGSTGAVSSLNSEMIAEEASSLYEHIAKISQTDHENVKAKEDIDLSLIFSKHESSSTMNATGEQNAQIENVQDTEQKAETNIASQERQIAILQKIRQSGNSPEGRGGCKMKDIQEMFLHISERTLRYDIQALIEKGLVERVGMSGPATYYKAREVAVA